MATHEWLRILHDEPAKVRSLAPWLRMLPPVGLVLTPETYTAMELSMLQGGELVRPCSIHCCA